MNERKTLKSEDVFQFKRNVYNETRGGGMTRRAHPQCSSALLHTHITCGDDSALFAAKWFPFFECHASSSDWYAFEHTHLLK